MNIKPVYNTFKQTFEDVLKQYKQSMLDYENAQNDDVEFHDIKLNKVATCADGWTKHFWISITVDLYGNLVEEPMETRYYLKTTPEKVTLQHDQLEERFAELWDLPYSVEEELIEAILRDVVEEFEMCFYYEFTAPSFSRLFKDGYLNHDMFSETARLKYYEKYGEDSMLTQELIDMFIF